MAPPVLVAASAIGMPAPAPARTSVATVQDRAAPSTETLRWAELRARDAGIDDRTALTSAAEQIEPTPERRPSDPEPAGDASSEGEGGAIATADGPDTERNGDAIATALTAAETAAEETATVETAVEETPLTEHELSSATAEEAIEGSLNGGFVVAEPVTRYAIKPLTVYGPDSTPDYFDADIMFIHAHPDDESIDFGAFMAKSAREGKRIVTVIFTDGESGLDLYPDRFVQGEYPAYDLEGEELAAVRRKELERAVTVLGSEHLIRFGLRNNPYAGSRDVLEAQEVIERWGGNALVARLVELMEGYTPNLIVSPDGPQEDAHEHFEHDAAGILASRAIEQLLARTDASFLSAHLVSVDKRFVEDFPEAIDLDVTEIDPASGRSYREIQLAALKQHITQRDAAMIAVRNLADYEYEHYIQRIVRRDAEITQLFVE